MRKVFLVIILCAVAIPLFSEEPIKYVPGKGRNPIYLFEDQEYRVDFWLGRGYLKLITAIEYDLAPDIPMNFAVLIGDYKRKIRIGQTLQVTGVGVATVGLIFSVAGYLGYPVVPMWFNLLVTGGSLALLVPGIIISNQPPTDVIMHYNENYGD